MTDHNQTDTTNTKNMHYIKSQIESLLLEAKDKASIESDIISFLVFSLNMYGKDENQTKQIAKISKILGESLGFDSEYCETLQKAGCIYDIGNLSISDAIYKKDNKLTFEEFSIIKNHTLVGYDLLKDFDFPSMQLGAIISAEHHEWWDGGGYPKQLKKNNIDIASRIVSVADTVGALSKKRPGREVWQFDKIVEYIEKRSGLQYDPDIVEAFLKNKEIIQEVLNLDLEEMSQK